MTKSQIRFYKSHYLARWQVFRHNQKHKNKILLHLDKFVIKNLKPGTTLAYQCLGEIYQDVIPNLFLEPATNCRYSNLVLINPAELKYKTPDEIISYLESLAQDTLEPNGRLIFSFEHRFLIYNRVEVSTTKLLAEFISKFRKYQLRNMLDLLNKSQPGYGDYFFCFEQQ